MTIFHGKDGVVSQAGNAIAEVRNFELNLSNEFAPGPAMGDQNIKKVAGQGDGEGTITCWYDPADNTGQGGLTEGDLVDLILQPQGVGSGLPQIDITNAGINGISQVQDVGGIVEKTFTFTLTEKNRPAFSTQT